MENYADITDPNYMGLCVPADGTLAVVADGSKYWGPAELEHEVSGNHGERILAMNYEPVLSMDEKLIDVVAWQDKDPTNWWTRTGRGIVLGAPELARVTFTDLPMYLVSTPAGYRYLRRSPQQLETVVILDWAAVQTDALFDNVWGRIFCTSRPLANRLEARHKECRGQPLMISVDEQPI